MAYKILIVEDSSTARKVIKKTIGLSGLPVAEILQAENGKKALEVLNDSWVDLILTDLNMPEMSGMELVDHLKGDEFLNSIPVVIVSTEGSQERIDQLNQKGICGFLRKPFQPEQIKEIINNILGE